MRGITIQEQTRDFRFPEILLLTGIAIVLIILATSVRPESDRSGLSLARPIGAQAQQFIAYAPDSNTSDKLALNSAAYTGTVILGGDQSPVEQLRVQKLENIVENARTPWKGEPVVSEATTQSLPYVSP
jgi:hypothetical protein